jgi:hypothetical protein
MSAAQRRRALIQCRIVPLLLLAPCLLISARSVLATSNVPSWFGRYSAWLLLFNVALVTGVLFAVLAFWRRMFRTAVVLIAWIFISTYLVVSNNSLLRIDRLLLLLVVARAGLGLLCCWTAFLSRQEQWCSRAANILLAGGVSLTTFALIDGAGALVLGPPASGSTVFSVAEFREPINLAQMDPQSIVVVGDSMVWGQGVPADRAFPEVLQSLLQERGTTSKVYNLGIIGAGLETYLAVLQQLARKNRAIVCYYMNYIPERQRPGMKLRQALIGLGRSSAVMRLASDAVGLRMYPDAEQYNHSVVQDYDPAEPTFAARWHQAESLLSAISIEAARGADRQPILVIVPMMWEFRSYPLRDVHTRLNEFARSVDFRVLDLLPDFERRFAHGKDYVVGPDDNHFNAEVHAHIAAVISELLASDLQ